MFTIYGCYIQFQFKLITAMYYFHENDPLCKKRPSKTNQDVENNPQQNGWRSLTGNKLPTPLGSFFFFNKRSDAILHMN